MSLSLVILLITCCVAHCTVLFFIWL